MVLNKEMNRKQKLRIVQISLLIIGVLVIFFTYNTEKNLQKNIFSERDQKEIQSILTDPSSTEDFFSNVKYSGLDLAGNRYILKSTSASINKDNEEVISMSGVDAVFYFKDNTTLKVRSNSGIYNNRTLDIDFKGDVHAKYQKSELFADKASYSNSQSFLSISENVKIIDIKGTMFADKLLFDIKKKKLNITSFNSNKINTRVNIE